MTLAVMQHPIQTFRQAVRWLAPRAAELGDAPLKLHTSGTAASDLLGSPPFSGEFWLRLSTDAFAGHDVTITKTCSLPHPLDVVCPRCDNNYSYTVTRKVYHRPFAAALSRLSHAPATSRAWPKPHAMILALIAAGFRLDGAARVIGHPIGSEDERTTVEAAFILAVRKLHDRYAEGPIPKGPSWTEQSDSQHAATIAGENAA